MKRVVLTDGSGRWFDASRARLWRGLAPESCELLYRTAEGQWVLRYIPDWSERPESYLLIDAHDAAHWLLANGYDPADSCPAEAAALEIK